MKERITKLREFYNSGATKPIDYRVQRLKTLKRSIQAHQAEIEVALWTDLHKSAEESYLTEISIVIQEIDLHISNLRRWSKPQRAKTPIQLRPSRSYIKHEPLGVALIIAPWNYPFQLILNPLIGAISAGCCAMLKTSPMAPATAKIVEQIIRESCEEGHVDIVHGEREVNTELLAQKYDMIFFTGSPNFGKAVYQAAAQNLTPVVLELGGKSPCIVDIDANIKTSARRIAWGKWLNAGQTCVAPDYLFVHSSMKDALLNQIVVECKKMYGEDASQSRFYARIVTKTAFDRLQDLMQGEKIYMGGNSDRAQKYIAPTILDNIDFTSKIMEEEIFGPLLPIITYESMDEVVRYINSKPKPLALYYFGGSEDQIIEQTSSGGACINDTIMHVCNHHLPFGGVGNSGMGRYHGRHSFEVFSNPRAIVKSPSWIDLPLKYPPFKYFKFIKRIL